MASSLMLPMHFVEVSTRNTVSEALESVYGPRWPWNHSFEFSLPSPHRGFNPRSELVTVHAREATTDKVVAELKFVFWQKMFTQRFDARRCISTRTWKSLGSCGTVWLITNRFCQKS